MSDATCAHHNDSERIACPVCLVTALRSALAVAQTKWWAHYLAQSIVDQIRADKAEAELAKERARLDYVLKNEWPFRDRDEIDNDMKEDAK